MSPPSLRYPRLKVERAKEHLDELDDKLKEFIKTNPVKYRVTEDIPNGLYMMAFRIPIIDPRLAVVAGDVAYNLRASLDHIAWQLALMNREQPYDRTAFPLIAKDGSDALRTFRSFTQDIPGDAAEVIKRFQPYRRGDQYQDDLLWKLDRLCNIDKHRIIPAHGIAVDFKIPPGVKPKVTHVADTVIVLMPLTVKEAMKNTPPPTTEVVFGSQADNISIGQHELSRIYDYVSGIVLPQFERFFTDEA